MECPFKKAEFIESSDRHVESYWTSTDCPQKECAWWDETRLCCGERTKRIQLERIADALMAWQAEKCGKLTTEN